MVTDAVRRKSLAVALFVILTCVWMILSTADGCPMDAEVVYVEVEPPITGWFTRDGPVHFIRTVLSTTFTLTFMKRRFGFVKILEVLDPDVSREKTALNYAPDDITVTCPDDVLGCTCQRFEISGLVDYNGIYTLSQLPVIHSDEEVADDGGVVSGDESDTNDDFIDQEKVAEIHKKKADVLSKQTWTLTAEKRTIFPDAAYLWRNDSANTNRDDADDHYNNKLYSAIPDNDEQSEHYRSSPGDTSFAYRSDQMHDRKPINKIARGNEPVKISSLLKAQIVQDLPKKDKTNRIRKGRHFGHFGAALQAKYGTKGPAVPKRSSTEKDHLGNVYSIFQKKIDSGELKRPSMSFDQNLSSKSDSFMHFKAFEKNKSTQQIQSTEKHSMATRQLLQLFPSMNEWKTLPKSLHNSSNFEYTGEGSEGKKERMKLRKNKISRTHTSREERSPQLTAAPSDALGILSSDWFSQALVSERSDLLINEADSIDRNDITGEEHLLADVNTIPHHFHVPTIKMDEEMEAWILEYDEIPLAMSDQRALCPDQSSGDWWQLLHGVENAHVNANSHPLDMLLVPDDDEYGLTTEGKYILEDSSDPTYENNDEDNSGSTASTGTTSSRPSQDRAVLAKRRITVTCLDSSDNPHPYTRRTGDLL